jgi:hypothetical protein
MKRKSENPRVSHPETPRRRASARRVVRRIAQGTILAAGLAISQFAIPEIDPRFHLFDRTLVDRLQSPITRYHE